MSHKPWYVVNNHYDKREAVGLGQIGIGILNPEVQPVVDEDNTIALLMAGEFYNHQHIRQELEAKGVVFRDASDAELALRLYQDLGDYEKYLRFELRD
jgi:asparagine synthase (glutamine-hydrolysing)